MHQILASSEKSKKNLGLAGKCALDFRYLTADGREADSVIEGRTDAQRWGFGWRRVEGGGRGPWAESESYLYKEGEAGRGGGRGKLKKAVDRLSRLWVGNVLRSMILKRKKRCGVLVAKTIFFFMLVLFFAASFVIYVSINS